MTRNDSERIDTTARARRPATERQLSFPLLRATRFDVGRETRLCLLDFIFPICFFFVISLLFHFSFSHLLGRGSKVFFLS